MMNSGQLLSEDVVLPEIPNPERVGLHKTIRVPSHFGRREGGIRQVFSYEDEAKMLDIFTDAGYVLERGGEFDYENPDEVGFEFEKDDREVARSLGIPAPEAADISDLVHPGSPLIAKIKGESQGLYKFLLSTTEQKHTFLSWLLCGRRIADYDSGDREEISQIVTSSHESVMSGTEMGRILLEIGPDVDYFFERFVDCPGNYYTSYRIVADGFGNIHYAQLHRSDEPKGKKLQSHKSYVPFVEDLVIGNTTDELLTHPRSPMYLDTEDVVSNISQGGKRILLNGNSVKDAEDCEVLTAHGIDPDNPHASKLILDWASQIAVELRGQYPFFGIDFIQDTSGNFFFLEANAGPGLNPEPLGIQLESSDLEKHIVVLQNMVRMGRPQ